MNDPIIAKYKDEVNGHHLFHAYIPAGSEDQALRLSGYYPGGAHVSIIVRPITPTPTDFIIKDEDRIYIGPHAEIVGPVTFQGAPSEGGIKLPSKYSTSVGTPAEWTQQ